VRRVLRAGVARRDHHWAGCATAEVAVLVSRALLEVLHSIELGGVVMIDEKKLHKMIAEAEREAEHATIEARKLADAKIATIKALAVLPDPASQRRVLRAAAELLGIPADEVCPCGDAQKPFVYAPLLGLSVGGLFAVLLTDANEQNIVWYVAALCSAIALGLLLLSKLEEK
jgi:hypothetical protein